MFTDDTNLIYSGKNNNALFLAINKKLQNVKHWFIADSFSLDVYNTKYSFFNNRRKKDNILLTLPQLSINNHKIERA